MRWSFSTDIRTLSEANVSRHWSRSRKTTKAQINAMAAHLARAQVPRGFLRKAVAEGKRVLVTLHRFSPQTLDSDNLVSSQKHTRDAIARWGELDDKDPRVIWTCTQGKNPVSPGKLGLTVTIEILV